MSLQSQNPSNLPSIINKTGYGPRTRYGRLLFDGDDQKYEQWEIKFLGYIRFKLKDTITAAEDTDIDAAKNEEAFAELIQFLDDKSLALVMRDAQDDGKKALKILRAHYTGTGKPRVISLYMELTSLVKLGMRQRQPMLYKLKLRPQLLEMPVKLWQIASS